MELRQMFTNTTYKGLVDDIGPKGALELWALFSELLGPQVMEGTDMEDAMLSSELCEVLEKHRNFEVHMGHDHGSYFAGEYGSIDDVPFIHGGFGDPLASAFDVLWVRTQDVALWQKHFPELHFYDPI